MELGKTASFTCKTGGFFPSDIRVRWRKGRATIQNQVTHVTPGPSKFTYNMSSTVNLMLQKDDIRSELTCEVRHVTLTAPLNRSYHLSHILRGEGSVGTGAHGPGAGTGPPRARGRGTPAPAAASLPSSPQRGRGSVSGPRGG